MKLRNRIRRWLGVDGSYVEMQYLLTVNANRIGALARALGMEMSHPKRDTPNVTFKKITHVSKKKGK